MKTLRFSQIIKGNDVYHVVRTKLTRSAFATLHRQDFPEVFWVEQGRGRHEVNGFNETLEPGRLVFVRQTDFHALMPSQDNDGLVIVNVAFSRESLGFLRKRYFAESNDLFWAEGRLPATRNLNPSQLLWLAGWVDRLDRAPKVRLEIEVFLLELLRETHDTAPPQATWPDWIEHARKAAADPAVFRGGTHALARACSRSPQHVNASLQKYLGLTATELLNRNRMDFAARTLRTGTQTILEICADSGFENLAHFYKLFKSQHGLSPRAYRLQYEKTFR